MTPKSPNLDWLQGCSPTLQAQVQKLLEQGQLNHYLKRKYPEANAFRTDYAQLEFDLRLYLIQQELQACPNVQEP